MVQLDVMIGDWGLKTHVPRKPRSTLAGAFWKRHAPFPLGRMLKASVANSTRAREAICVMGLMLAATGLWAKPEPWNHFCLAC